MKKLLRRMMKQQTKHLKLTIKMALKGWAEGCWNLGQGEEARRVRAFELSYVNCKSRLRWASVPRKNTIANVPTGRRWCGKIGSAFFQKYLILRRSNNFKNKNCLNSPKSARVLNHEGLIKLITYRWLLKDVIIT
jgi:hypothetical protein